MTKKKISGFEFAIMEIADPEESKNHEPFTKEERINIRKDNLLKTAKNLKIKIMNKSTVIQAHWIELGFEPSQPDKNGWIDFDFLPDDFDTAGLESKRIDFETLLVRPKSLSGIENNNGWIKIESNPEYPKDPWCKYITCNVDKINIYPICRKTLIRRWNDITHYQPIQEPQPPIH